MQEMQDLRKSYLNERLLELLLKQLLKKTYGIDQTSLLTLSKCRSVVELCQKSPNIS